MLTYPLCVDANRMRIESIHYRIFVNLKKHYGRSTNFGFNDSFRRSAGSTFVLC